MCHTRCFLGCRGLDIYIIGGRLYFQNPSCSVCIGWALAPLVYRYKFYIIFYWLHLHSAPKARATVSIPPSLPLHQSPKGKSFGALSTIPLLSKQTYMEDLEHTVSSTFSLPLSLLHSLTLAEKTHHLFRPRNWRFKHTIVIRSFEQNNIPPLARLGR